MFYLVETGLVGEPACFDCVASEKLPRGTEVICRTPRGIETGRIAVCLGGENSGLEVIGRVLRPMSDNDRLISRRLDQFRDRAIAACSDLLLQHGSEAVLLDAEQLFDGENLYFHFLGEVDDSLTPVLDRLAEVYQQKIRFRQFADRLANGCGPGCGTTASKCGTGGACSTCSAGGCGVKSGSVAEKAAPGNR